ncbi:MAG TPA: penicillin-binding transpeptidase domain-containing protein [Silvibacterium sp.]|nr:penicillin-binding transpeptidase domain-containing protein [Silvibacterium sp.]
MSRNSFSPVSSHPVVTPMRRLRVFSVLGLLIFWCVLICGRLIWLQVFRHHYYVEQAAKEQEHSFEVAPRRGILYDRNMHALAMTVLVDSVYAVPSEITDKAATATALAKIVHTDATDRFTTEKQILARLNASHAFAWIARKQDPRTIARVKDLNLKGVYLQKEFKRFYPDNQIAAQVLGYVGIDDSGLGGLEEEFDDDLHGTPGRMLTALDAKRHVLGSTERDPLPGENLVLTIDENIQFMAEQALDRNMERTHAQNGTVIVQDPHTGQILALAVRPTFNPNNFRHANASLLRDHAVSDVYEPGSTFKLVAYSAALEEHVTTPDSMLNTLGGQINVAGRIVHDDRDAIRFEAQNHNVISTTQALEQSSDVAAIELAERMGVNRFYSYIHAYRFGERTGIELPAETRGLLKPPRRWEPTTIGSIPMGQEIGVTPLQLITMASTIANGGEYLPPHILLQSSDEEKNGRLEPAAFHPEHELPNPLPDGAHRVISTLTSAEMRKMMEGVVEHGTGIPAQLNGYSAAGKTGTAEKIDPRTHTYSKTKYVASFVGFAPVNDPAVTIVVVMDSPSYEFHYGTGASAPVFHELAQQILEYLGVPHDEDVKSTQEMASVMSHSQGGDEPAERIDDLNSLFDEVNHLPADDPLRAKQETAALLPVAKGDSGAPDSGEMAADDLAAAQLPDSALPGSTGKKSGKKSENVSGKDSSPDSAGETSAQQYLSSSPSSPGSQSSPQTGVVVSSNNNVAVPSLLGEPVRAVIEQAGAAGLGVQVLGSGIARQQVPAAGTKVPAGTQIVVQFGR